MNKNPYDFVRTNWSLPPGRTEKVFWHHKFQGLSGRIDCRIIVKSPIFIPMSKHESKHEFYYRREKTGEKTYLIPGSSLKGMLRNLVETVGNGCYSKFDRSCKKGKGQKDFNLEKKLPKGFEACRNNKFLCIGCRLFGMMGGDVTDVFKGNVGISDAKLMTPVSDDIFEKYELGAMGGPSPRHTSFYLDKEKRNILGRKFYYHHRAHNALNRAAQAKKAIKKGNFEFHIDFNNMDQDDFPALLYALVLEDGMWHKIGYGKPQGLGSIKIICEKIVMRDMKERYLSFPGASQCYEAGELKVFINKICNAFIKDHPSPDVLNDLRKVWGKEKFSKEKFDYPTKDWFEKHPEVSLEEYQNGKRE